MVQILIYRIKKQAWGIHIQKKKTCMFSICFQVFINGNSNRTPPPWMAPGLQTSSKKKKKKKYIKGTLLNKAHTKQKEQMIKYLALKGLNQKTNVRGIQIQRAKNCVHTSAYHSVAVSNVTSSSTALAGGMDSEPGWSWCRWVGVALSSTRRPSSGTSLRSMFRIILSVYFALRSSGLPQPHCVLKLNEATTNPQSLRRRKEKDCNKDKQKRTRSNCAKMEQTIKFSRKIQTFDKNIITIPRPHVTKIQTNKRSKTAIA